MPPTIVLKNYAQELYQEWSWLIEGAKDGLRAGILSAITLLIQLGLLYINKFQYSDLPGQVLAFLIVSSVLKGLENAIHNRGKKKKKDGKSHGPLGF